jgi:hypothetical protein
MTFVTRRLALMRRDNLKRNRSDQTTVPENYIVHSYLDDRSDLAQLCHHSPRTSDAGISAHALHQIAAHISVMLCAANQSMQAPETRRKASAKLQQLSNLHNADAAVSYLTIEHKLRAIRSG